MRYLLTAILSGLLVCTSSQASADATSAARVATFSCDVTPPLGHRLTVEPLKSVEHPLAAKGIVLDDGSTRYVLCAIDWCIVSNHSYRRIRDKIAAAAGTDARHVCVQTVHQHTAPVIDADAAELLRKTKNPPKLLSTTAEFVDQIADRIAAAVKESLGRLEPFDTIGTGQAKVDRIASARRMPRGDGRVFPPRYSFTKDPKIRTLPEGQIDPFLRTITLAKGDKPLVRLHYYAVHPQTWYRDGRASFDFVGLARQALEKKEGVFQVYFTGCAGNVTVGKYNDATPASRDRFMERLQNAMEAAIAATKYVPAGKIQWRSVPLSLPIRDDKGHAQAEFHALAANAKAKDQMRGLAARRIVYANRSDQPIDVSTLRIGNVSIVHLPGEPFLEFQLYAQQLRPDEFVAVAGYGDGGPCYLCTEASYAEGGYEPWASGVKPESETIIRNVIRQALAD
ncbi:MAG: hypothetical protein JW888_10890 [Pirellulales bacterium]|nr:hypothetical protein [Pirellulales bacterium]